MGSETGEFAALLRDLKTRSGRSYGALASKLHMSTSTVHRYCNGDAVPTDYAPVERFGRLCAASPDELVELHRRWILADAGRRRPKGAAVADAGPELALRGADSAAGGAPDPAAGPGPAPEREPEPAPRPPTAEPAAPAVRRTKRRLRLTVAALVVAAAAVPTAVVVLHSGSRAPSDTASVAGASEIPVPPRVTPRASSPARTARSAAPSGSASPAAPRSASPSAALGSPDGGSVPAVPLAVSVRPYIWDDPCSQWYLVNRQPSKVPPPPAEQDAKGWADALGGVSSGGARIELAVQGKSADVVVLQALHIRVVGRHAPLAWASYAMGDGCGGGLVPAAFDVNLDAGTPLARATAGVQGDRRIPATDFPYQVSATDPQVLEVNAHTSSQDVSWYLELQWSSGSRHGTLRLDDHGRPFRASGAKGRPQYVHPLGGDAWEPAVQP
ncbi:helix-turn-helix domain-containing protein [Streptomyces sp. NBC_00344]